MGYPMRFVPLCCIVMAVATLPGIGQEPTPSASVPGQSSPVGADDKPMHIGGTVLPPKVIYSVSPTFTEQARRQPFSGNVQVYLWVDEHGNPSHVRVVRGVGMGLDEKAVEAVRQYKFKPATRDGVPVKVDLYIDVNFQVR
jgi:TonB family protein